MRNRKARDQSYHSCFSHSVANTDYLSVCFPSLRSFLKEHFFKAFLFIISAMSNNSAAATTISLSYKSSRHSVSHVFDVLATWQQTSLHPKFSFGDGIFSLCITTDQATVKGNKNLKLLRSLYPLFIKQWTSVHTLSQVFYFSFLFQWFETKSTPLSLPFLF